MKHADLIITDVESITVRDMAGEGSQALLAIRTKDGTFDLRVVGRRGRVIRITDLRTRDRRKRTRFITVPMTEVAP